MKMLLLSFAVAIWQHARGALVALAVFAWMALAFWGLPATMICSSDTACLVRLLRLMLG
jgi:hypothetical protein